MKIDYLIIGQGLAGSLLAWELHQRHKKIILVDNAKENASLVAAGLINPVTGMRFVKSSDVDQLLPAAIHYYQQLEEFFRQVFYIEKPMLRILKTEKEYNNCIKRFQQNEYHPYLAEIIAETAAINAPFGLLKQRKTGYLLTEPLLTALKNYFISINVYQCMDLNYDEIVLFPTLQWRNIKPKHIIFCEGFHGSRNPWFSYLPFQPVKGEIITATSKQPLNDQILNYGHWFIPLNSNRFRTGATFDREILSTETTVKAKQHLLACLHDIQPHLEIEHINKQQAGIRPATLDKQPFIGHHPQHPKLTIFNGFGAKGSLQIPSYCQLLVENLQHQLPIPANCNIQRYN